MIPSQQRQRDMAEGLKPAGAAGKGRLLELGVDLDQGRRVERTPIGRYRVM